MKYIDADRLRSEIERRMEETKSMKPSFDQFWAGQISAFKGCLNFIDSLQQEQPEVNYDDAVSQFVKIPYTGERWFSTTDGEFIAGALFEEPIPADAELYYKKEDKK